MNSSLAGLYVGTSGFYYTSWRGPFYPRDAKPREFLQFYAERLPSVELNNPFYELPSEDRIAGWANETPDGFRFAIKMSRRITHFGRLEWIPTFCARVRALGEKLGPVLVQFPPTRPRDDGFLRLFLDSLDPSLQYAFEFRHESWAGTDDMLAEAGVARVGELAGEAPFRYLRLREPPYDESMLAAWAKRLAPLLAEDVEVYCYFKHEDEPRAPAYAARLLEILSRDLTAPSTTGC
jgi:uncharacterized protein YecE (DUF72 family)